jgi:acyl carrier protein
MDETETRLRNCFATVFPELSMEEIRQATTGSVAKWDSVTNIMLLSIIDEEFGIAVDVDDYEELTSFGLLLDYIRRRQSSHD